MHVNMFHTPPLSLPALACTATLLWVVSGEGTESLAQEPRQCPPQTPFLQPGPHGKMEGATLTLSPPAKSREMAGGRMEGGWVEWGGGKRARKKAREVWIFSVIWMSDKKPRWSPSANNGVPTPSSLEPVWGGEERTWRGRGERLGD